ncbi:MAG: Fe-S cluster assembly protein SufD [Bacteroidetes bacterium]|nr:MAG: Fe-S cluster assembly protein SufD [Bacteroidota bacterium]
MTEAIQEKKFEIAQQSGTSAFSTSSTKEARKEFATLELPTTRMEAWKYTRLAKLKRANLRISDEETVSRELIKEKLVPGIEGSVLVFVNGFFQESLSEIQAESALSITACSNADQLLQFETVRPNEADFFDTMNQAYATDGVELHVRKGETAGQVVQCLFLTVGNEYYAGVRNSIHIESGAAAEFIFLYDSEKSEQCLNHSLTNIQVDQQATLTLNLIQNSDPQGFCVNRSYVSQARDSKFSINTITLDGLLVRNDLFIRVDGSNAETHLNGAYILKGKQHVDNHTTVDHRVAHCESNELYKGVMDEESTAVFNGKVFVRQDAQKINAFQSNGNVLLSDSATVNSKPELEIYADDVKCSHGSTTGQLDEEAVFYLRARGLSEKSARSLMVSAFIGEVLDQLGNEELHSHIYTLLERKYAWVL